MIKAVVFLGCENNVLRNVQFVLGSSGIVYEFFRK